MCVEEHIWRSEMGVGFCLSHRELGSLSFLAAVLGDPG